MKLANSKIHLSTAIVNVPYTEARNSAGEVLNVYSHPVVFLVQIDESGKLTLPFPVNVKDGFPINQDEGK